ncbi:MAG: putative sugar O-methyltransferase, partial [Actinomycetota bacterium]
MRRFDELLTAMIEDSTRADRRYRATTFWEIAGAPIVDDLRVHGVTHFREHRSARRYYAPMYGRPEYLDRRESIERWLRRMPARRAHSVRWRLDGRHAARVDARLFRATDVAGGLDLGGVSESQIGGGERFEIGGQRYSRSLLNYLRALTLLKRQAATDDVESALEIGGARVALLHSHDARRFRAAKTGGEYDLVCYGHTHVAKIERVGETV